MIEKIKFFVSGAAVVAFLFFIYNSGKEVGPDISYERVYENVIKDNVQKNDEAVPEDSGEAKKFSYIPAYSHIYISNGKAIEMAITLSLRNIDRKHPVKIETIFYYNTKGKLIRKYLKDGYTLQPLETKEIFVERNDLEGGSGANFFVEYTLVGTLDPLFETIMATNHIDGKPYIFSSRGQNL